MEQRYYLSPGQTLANTKVVDRGHGLHMTTKEWHRIGKHLDRKKDIQDELDKEEAKRKFLQDGSQEMIKHWDNSLENIRKNKEEARIRRLEQAEEDRMQRFFQLRDEQAQVRKEYVEKVKKKMFMESGWARDINTAYVTSEVLFEREKQKDFKKYLQKHEDEVEAEYAKVVKKNAKDEEEEKAAKKQKLYDDRKEYGKYLKQIIEENERKVQLEEQTRLSKESVDNMKSIKEMALIKKTQQDQREKEKRELKLDKEKYLKAKEELKKQMEQEEKEMDDVLEIYRKAKHQIECLKRDKTVELQEAIIARRELVAKQVAGKEELKLAEEEKRHLVAEAEKIALEDAKNKEKAEFNESNRRERIEQNDNVVKKKEEEKRKETELKKWDMVNRYKIAEYRKEYEQMKKKELWEEILDRRKELLEQMEEDEEKRTVANDMDFCLSKISFVGDDDKFYDYADEVLQLTKKKRRSTYPIEKVILEYKKFYSLMPEGKKCEACEDYNVKEKSMSRELLKNSVKKKKCKCHQ